MANIERRGDNTFRIRISNGSDSEGNRKTVKRTIDVDSGLTEKQKIKEAERIAAQLEAEVKRGTFLDAGKITFTEFVEEWKKKYAIPQLGQKTLYRYEEMLRTRILPAIGHIRLEKLQPTHLLQFYENLKEKGVRLNAVKYLPKPELTKVFNERYPETKNLKREIDLHHVTVDNLIAGKPVNSKTAKTVCKFLDMKESELFTEDHNNIPLDARTILHHHRLISSILTCAVQWQLLISNPASRIKPPKVERHEAEHYDVDQAIRILEYADMQIIETESADLPEKKKLFEMFRVHKNRAFLYVVLYGGLREGELAGLKWDCVNQDVGIIEIKMARQYIPGKGSFDKSTKNESSDRLISLPGNVFQVLKEYKAAQNALRLKCGDAWTDSGFVFTQAPEGDPIHPYWATNWFPRYIKQYNNRIRADISLSEDQKKDLLLPCLNFHATRHTNATLLIANGVNIKTVSNRLGHSVTSTTMNIYSHSLKSAEKEAATRLEDMLSGKAKNNKISNV